MFAVLRRPGFSLLWFGQLISVAGDWMLFIALPFYVFQLTGSALATSVMFVAQTAPRVLFGSAAGVFVDRWNRKTIMIAADVSRAALLLPLSLVHSVDSLWIVYAVACVQATIAQFFVPAKTAVIPRLVGNEHLTQANSLNALSDNLARLIMPPLGGALLGILGLAAVVGLDSVSFLGSALMIGMITIPPAAPDSGEHHAGGKASKHGWAFWGAWLEGIKLVKSEQVVGRIFLVVAIATLAEGLMNVLFVVFVKSILHGGSVEFGWLVGVQGLGGLVGAITVGRFGRRIRPNLLIGLSGIINGCLLFAAFNYPSFRLALILVGLAGVPTLAFFIGMQTLLQRSVSDGFLGRIFGSIGTLMAVMLLLGQSFAGVLGDNIGVLPMLDVLASFNLVAGLVALVTLARASRPSSAVSPAALEADSAAVAANGLAE